MTSLPACLQLTHNSSAAQLSRPGCATLLQRQQQRTCCCPSNQHRRPKHRLAAVSRTAYSNSYETSRLMKTLLTRQAVKTCLNYLSETNGQLHLFLHNYVAEHPLPLAGDTDADAWLAALAACPLTTLADPRRSSTPSAAAAAAVLQGERQVSPRDAAERIMGLREHIAAEVAEDLGAIRQANADVRRRALELTVSEFNIGP